MIILLCCVLLYYLRDSIVAWNVNGKRSDNVRVELMPLHRLIDFEYNTHAV